MKKRLTMALLAAFSALFSGIVAASCENWALVLIFAALSSLNLGIAIQNVILAFTPRRKFND